MSQLRVLIVTTGLGTGGAEHMLCKLIEAAESNEIRFMVVSLRDQGDFGARLHTLGVPLVCCEFPYAAALLNFPRILRSIRAFEPNVVQGWMYHGCVAASMFAKLLPDRPSVVWGIRQTLYSLNNERVFTRFIIKLMARHSGAVSRIIYNSKTSRIQHRELGFSDRFDEIVPNGFDLSRYRLDSIRRSDFRQAHGIGDHEKLIGLVARVHPMKDHRTFVAAASIIASRLSNVRFVLAGLGTDQPEILTMLAEANLAERAICLGRFEHTEKLYPGLDLLVLSSAWGEGWPNVLGEGMACGVPCVATDVGESAEIIGENGKVVPPGDAVALASACVSILDRSLNPIKFGQRLRESIEQRFGIAEIADRYKVIWERARRSNREIQKCVG